MVDIIHMSLVIVFSVALLWADNKHIPIGSHKYESKYVPPTIKDIADKALDDIINDRPKKSEPSNNYLTVEKATELLEKPRKQYSAFTLPKMPQMPRFVPDYPPKMNEYLRKAIEERKISNNDQRLKELNDRMNALMDYHTELIKNNVSDKFAEHIKRQIDEIAEERNGLRKVQTNDQKA